jgi:hypothetical protein
VAEAEQTLSYDMSIRGVLGGRALHCFQAMNLAGGFGTLLSYFILIGDFAVIILRMVTGR